MSKKQKEFIDICLRNNYDVDDIIAEIKQSKPNYTVHPHQVETRIAKFIREGKLPIQTSGNSVSIGEVLKGTTTTYDAEGNIKRQSVRTEVPKQNMLAAFNEALTEMAETLVTPQPKVKKPKGVENDEIATLYISNDVHFGALMWAPESGEDWDTELATKTIKSAYDYLFACSPSSKVGIVCDLGDLLEVDNDKNMTPKSGNILSVDSRFPKILRAAYEALIYAVNKALEKHETVYFYNIAGNHDINAGIAVREVIRVAFKDNPRVIVDEAPSNIKYHQHGKTLLQFAHGDGMKMRQSGEAMAVDCKDIFSATTHRFAHFGHTHKDAVVDMPICRAESHRNIAPLNHWAYNHGYRGGAGTMKSITYHVEHGEISRQTFNVGMVDSE